MRTTKVEHDGGTRFSLSRVSNKRKPRKLFTVPVLYQLQNWRTLFPSCRWLPVRGGEGCTYAAYGRDYKSRKEVLAAINAPVDFNAHVGLVVRYATGTDLLDDGFGALNVRYGELRKVASFKAKGGTWV